MTRKYRKRGGAANFESSPGMFASPYAKVGGVGCAGTKSNVLAANSVYQPYSQFGGTYGISKEPLSSNITGTSAGHAAINRIEPKVVKSDLQMGGKRRRRSRRGGTKKRKRGGSRRRRRRSSAKGSRRGTKSKTHRGKNYETRKSSKRYRSGKFKKYLRGRKTMRAPDFPFAGGGPGGHSSVGAPVPSSSSASQGQPYSNIPYTPGYSAGTQLPPNLSALANPVPYKAYNHCSSN